MDLKPKTLDDVVDVFDAYNINLVMGLMLGNLREDRRILGAFIDYTEAAIPLNEIFTILKKIPGVFNVEFKEGLRNDLAVCQLHYPPTVLGEESVVFRLSVLKSWFNRLWEVFGSGAAKIFYEAGVKAGKDAAKFFAEKLRLEGEMLARFMASVGSSLGWGRFTLEELDMEKNKLRVRAENLFECKLAGKPGEARGYFIRGYILGAATQIFKTENLTIEETKCIAKGDPYCEFQIKPTH
jgi:predicted hydrocarbon binding protein